MRMMTSHQLKGTQLQCPASNAWIESSTCHQVREKPKLLKGEIVVAVLALQNQDHRQREMEKDGIQPRSTCSTFYQKSRRGMS